MEKSKCPICSVSIDFKKINALISPGEHFYLFCGHCVTLLEVSPQSEIKILYNTNLFRLIRTKPLLAKKLLDLKINILEQKLKLKQQTLSEAKTDNSEENILNPK